VWRDLVMHTTHGAALRIEGSAALCNNRHQPVLSKLSCAVGAREKASVIAVRLDIDLPSTCKLQFRESHAGNRELLDETHGRNRNHELSSAGPILRLLLQNLICEIPGEQQHVIRHRL
jgi:hypothetical protein